MEVLKTVRDFITGYCDALAHVNMTGEREIVEISSDEEGEDNDTKVQQEIDESSFLLVNWVDVEVCYSYFSLTLAYSATGFHQ